MSRNKNINQKSMLFWTEILTNDLSDKALNNMHEHLNKQKMRNKILEGYYLGLAIVEEINRKPMHLDHYFIEHILFIVGYYLAFVKTITIDDAKDVILSLQESKIDTLLQYINCNLKDTKDICLQDVLSTIFNKKAIPFIRNKDSEYYKNILDPIKKSGYLDYLHILSKEEPPKKEEILTSDDDYFDGDMPF